MAGPGALWAGGLAGLYGTRDLHLRWHDLPHTHASWLLAGGADLKTVMDRLGHSQLSTTQQYLHTLPNTDDTALTALARIRGR